MTFSLAGKTLKVPCSTASLICNCSFVHLLRRSRFIEYFQMIKIHLPFFSISQVPNIRLWRGSMVNSAYILGTAPVILKPLYFNADSCLDKDNAGNCSFSSQAVSLPRYIFPSDPHFLLSALRAQGIPWLPSFPFSFEPWNHEASNCPLSFQIGSQMATTQLYHVIPNTCHFLQACHSSTTLQVYSHYRCQSTFHIKTGSPSSQE